jgi:hypothetical protein
MSMSYLNGSLLVLLEEETGITVQQTLSALALQRSED